MSNKSLFKFALANEKLKSMNHYIYKPNLHLVHKHGSIYNSYINAAICKHNYLYRPMIINIRIRTTRFIIVILTYATTIYVLQIGMSL